MWHLVKSSFGYGLIYTDSAGRTTQLCRISDRKDSSFWVTSVTSLTAVMSDCSPTDFSSWIANVPATVLCSFKSDSPLTHLKAHYPEYYV